jgi:two-component system, OmpR family, response regulator
MSDRRQRILIVDDEESIRRSLRAYLEDEGYEVVDVGKGEEGLNALVVEPADAAIVDMRLPGMDGNAFVEQAHHLLPKMAFFIYTGSVGYKPPASLQAIGVGEEHVFKKPLGDIALLVDAMRKSLELR